MSFWGSLLGGQNKTLSSDMSQFGQIGSFATNKGESNVSKASDYWSSILGGDASKTAKTLAPQIGAAKESAQQDTKKAAEQGTRSGGTAASTAATSDKTRATITGQIGNLTSSSASNLGQMGSSLMSQGMQAYGQQMNASQLQISNWKNSILGKDVGKTFVP